MAGRSGGRGQTRRRLETRKTSGQEHRRGAMGRGGCELEPTWLRKSFLESGSSASSECSVDLLLCVTEHFLPENFPSSHEVSNGRAAKNSFAEGNPVPAAGRFRGPSGRAPFTDERGFTFSEAPFEGNLHEGLKGASPSEASKGFKGLKGASRGLQRGLKGA